MSANEDKRSVVSITTLGCKVNQCESDSLARHLTQNGAAHIQKTGDAGTADVCIINTCTVTHKAAMQSRQAIRQAVRHHPEAQIVVTGCYAQTEPDVIAGIEGVDAVVGHRHKFDLPKLLNGQLAHRSGPPERLWSPVRETADFAHLPVSAFGHRTRPFLRIQDGCDAFCTYCIVPHARGASRSMPTALVMEQLAALTSEGFREVVLTGIHVGAYGLDLSPPTSLAELLKTLSEGGVVDQLRLSSIEPAELTPQIIATVAASQDQPSGRICPHFHIPLQSGDDEILARMHRPYSGAHFDDLVLGIHRRLPTAAIGADTLIGFPGESETAFENTYRRIEALPITYLHVFPFSPRKGTPAYHFKERVPDPVVKERCRRMRELGERKKRAFYRSLIGRELSIIVEGVSTGSAGAVKGLSGNYVPVEVACQGPRPERNQVVTARIDTVTEDLRVLGRQVQ